MLTILVVDDEKLERKGIRFLLNRRSEEMEILEAANGKAACEILQHRTVDIMLTDIKAVIFDIDNTLYDYDKHFDKHLLLFHDE